MIPSVLADQVRRGVEDFLKTTFPITTNHFRHPDGTDVMDDLIGAEGGIFKGPYLSVGLPFRTVKTEGEFFEHVPLGVAPYLHQRIAFERLAWPCPRSTLVATGTGSGKTECFLLPILNYCYEQRHRPGIKAILVYPMNALAGDQAGRIARLIHNNPKLRGQVTAGLYVGGGGGKAMTMGPANLITNRDTLRLKPPDILLTNYKMLDYLLIRPQDLPLWEQNGPETLQYLVVDELHTFDGAQGTDLACLIRRLKERLKTPKDHLCAVGTSATLGGDVGGAALIQYAQSVFGEPFDNRAVVVENRISAGEFLEESYISYIALPPASRQDALDPDNFDGVEDYIRTQHELWFGPPEGGYEGDGWRVTLGERLKEHLFFQNLLKALRGQVRSLPDLLAELQKVTRELKRAEPDYCRLLVMSLLALVSTARQAVGGGEGTGGKETGGDGAASGSDAGAEPAAMRPFLDVRVQLWLRELRRMVCSVHKSPAVRFADDLNRERLCTHLPLVHCRDCGAMGWAGMKRKLNSQVQPDLQAFYIGFFGFDPKVTYLFPVTEDNPPGSDDEELRQLCPACLHLGNKDQQGCINCDHKEPIGVFVPNVRRTTVGNRQQSHHDCPFCAAKNGLTLMGSRAASLISVQIAQIFSSTYNDDKKLLTFSDSVQDAAHRAGFFGARTYRFSFRGALQQFVLNGGSGLTLDELPRAFCDYWRERLDEEQFLTTFLAPNMAWMRDYEHLLACGHLPDGSSLPNLVKRRIGWEIFSEYGFNCRIGRTLEKTNSSVATLDPALLDRILPTLLESLQNEVGELRDLDADTLRRYLLGLLVHLKNMGGICHPVLEGSYMAKGGSTYLLNRQNWMPNFGGSSRAPTFVTNSRSGTRFEPVYSAAGRQSWHINWTIRTLFAHHLLYGDGPDRALQVVIHALSQSDDGLLVQQEGNRCQVWGLKPAALRISPKVAQLGCGYCGHHLSVARAETGAWEGTCCLRYQCRGHYAVLPETPDYYGKLYASGHVQRIFAEEHTGLMDRGRREELEGRFKAEGADRKPWHPNLLSCTPTLEMGIDIGDLSSMILCSVPPTQANYLQRIGRSGRRDGNALNLTVANAHPHDLFFFSQPEEMIAGRIETPGVFLNAAAVLERQFTAYCFDRWVETGKASLPHTLGQVLGGLNPYHKHKFPHNLLLHIETHRTELLERFFGMFPELSDESEERLRAFAEGERKNEGSLAWRVINRLEGLEREKKSFESKSQSLKRKINTLQNSPAKDQNYQEDLLEIKREREALLALVRHIRERVTFNFFTDEGLIPNYAFPEAGVMLKSVIYRKKEQTKEGESKYDTWVYEYERPAVSAISELAPESRFYAGGRRVTIDQIDMAVSEVETWRFCDSCAYMEQAGVGAGGGQKTCPRCGSVMWADEGQRKNMLRMRTVFASTSDNKSRIGDHSDDREPSFFTRQILVDFEYKNVTHGYRIDGDEMPFGYEFLSRCSFRDINFGEKGELGKDLRIAGVELPRRGFTICRHCGKVQRPKGEIEHAFTCPARNKDAEKNFTDCVYLYREFSSEAIRILLPVTTFAGSDRMLHSFVAALHLGLKRKFKGNIDHLRTTEYEEPVQGADFRKKYLMLYDTVPGGTGYLKQLTSSAEDLMDVFGLALAVLKSCRCNQEAERDGCYRCLYAYRSSYNMPETSREAAIELLSDIIKYKGKLVQTDTILNIDVNSLFDSELEARFIEAFRRMGGRERPVTVKKELVHGKPGYFLKVGDQAYSIEPQVSMDESQGVSIESKADFVLWPAKRQNEIKPIVIFTDGFQFHRDRIGKDMAKRMAISQSGRFHVWSLTWSDVESRLKDSAANDYMDYLNPASAPNKRFSGVRDLLQGRIPFEEDVHAAGSFELLMRHLQRPEVAFWQNTAFIHALMFVQMPTTDQQEWLQKVRLLLPAPLGEAMDLTGGGPCLCGNLSHTAQSGGGIPLELMVSTNNAAVRNCCPSGIRILCRLDDAKKWRDREDFQQAWAGYLRAYNLLQFLPHCYFVTTSGLDGQVYDSLTLLADACVDRQTVSPITAAQAHHAHGSQWGEIRDLVDRRVKGLLDYLEENQVCVPEPGYALTDHRGAVVAEAELGWEAERVAILTAEELEYKTPFEGAGWQVYSLDGAIADPGALLSQLRRESEV